MSRIVEYAILNDVHMPDESPMYETVMRFLASRESLAGIYLNGDILECEGITAHPKHPGSSRRFSEEIEYANDKLDDIEATFQGVPVVLIEGNHCFRMFRYIRDRAPELYGLRGSTIADQLQLAERRNFSFVPYGPMQLAQCGVSKLWLRHEPLRGGANHAKATAEKSLVDLAYGHTHVYQVATHTKYGPKPLVTTAYSLGHLADKTKATFDYRGPNENWVEMFSLVQCDSQSGEYKLHALDVGSGAFVFEGVAWSNS